MATPASRMMLSKSLPLHILRACLSSSINTPAFTQVPHQGSNFVKFLLGYESSVASPLNNEGVNNCLPPLRFGEMGRLEARGKKVVVDDDDEDYDGSDDDPADDMSDDVDFDDDDDGDWDDDVDDGK